MEERNQTVHRIAEARGYLRYNGVDLDSWCKLTGPQIEELAAIVNHMLSEKPADYESEVRDGA
jgi:hypothetical protein